MKKFEVYRYLDGNGEEVALQGGMKDSDYYLGDIEANTYKEAVIKAYEKYGECIIRWVREDGYEGRADYDVNEYVYKIAKNKES